MVKAFPLNQQEYSYNAQDVMKYYAGRNSGIFENGDNLKVSVNSGLEVNVNSGVGWLSKDYVASVVFWNESPMALTVEAGNDTYDRIDLVVVSWNFVNQDDNPEIVIRKGTPSVNPAVPSLVNDNSTIEIALAKINVVKGTVSLDERNVVDLRGDNTYCPMVYDEQTIREEFGKRVGYSDALSYEEIMATTDLTNKVASASAVKSIGYRIRTGYFRIATVANSVVNITADTIILGNLPPTNSTVFIVANVGTQNYHITTFSYDSSNLFVSSNVSQVITVTWFNFY